MKKLLLLAAFGLMASPVLAQNNDAQVNQSGNGSGATVDQAGQDNEAFVDQHITIPYSGAEAFVYQTGNSQLADIEQTGASPRAYAFVEQSNGSGTGDNEARITQNRAQDDSDAFVYQTGTTNFGSILQTAGGVNWAEIHQGQTDDASAENRAEVTQRDQSGGFAVRTDAKVYQDGLSNEAYVDQSLAINAEAFIDQDGTDNWADIDQQNTETFDPNHQASITQNGNLNEAQVLQEGTSHSMNFATVLQAGDENDAFVDQDGDGGSHYMEINQNGIGNAAGVSGTALFQSGSNHFLDVDQIGDGNVATSIQAGDDHTATIMQTGGMNEANVQQSN